MTGEGEGEEEEEGLVELAPFSSSSSSAARSRARPKRPEPQPTSRTSGLVGSSKYSDQLSGGVIGTYLGGRIVIFFLERERRKGKEVGRGKAGKTLFFFFPSSSFSCYLQVRTKGVCVLPDPRARAHGIVHVPEVPELGPGLGLGGRRREGGRGGEGAAKAAGAAFLRCRRGRRRQCRRRRR